MKTKPQTFIAFLVAITLIFVMCKPKPSTVNFFDPDEYKNLSPPFTTDNSFDYNSGYDDAERKFWSDFGDSLLTMDTVFYSRIRNTVGFTTSNLASQFRILAAGAGINPPKQITDTFANVLQNRYQRREDNETLGRNKKASDAVFFLWKDIGSTISTLVQTRPSGVHKDSIGVFFYFGNYDKRNQMVKDSLKNNKDRMINRRTSFIQLGYFKDDSTHIFKQTKRGAGINKVASYSYNFGKLCPDYCPTNGTITLNN